MESKASEKSSENKGIKKIKDNWENSAATNLNQEKDLRKRRDSSILFPDWTREKSSLSWDFVDLPKSKHKNIGPIGVLPKETQEHLLINDMLYCLSGIGGDYIEVTRSKNKEPIRLNIDGSTDACLLELTKRLLPIISNYSIIMKFVEERFQFEYGLINHALCAAIHHLLKDYFILIAQLEHQHLQSNLSLQKMWFYLQPCMSKLNTVAIIVNTLTRNDYFGGAVLSLLHEQAAVSTGDTVAQEICFHLASAASVPYFEILEKWIYKGIIFDPYSEFFVKDNEQVKKDESESCTVEYSDDYWEKRYTIEKDEIPKFLEKVADMILRTGKYLNVIRQCGHDIKCPSAKPVTYVIREQYYFDIIQSAYSFASQNLLDLLMNDNDLMGRLRSLKHYYFMDQADFVVQFMDMAEEELYKKINDIMPTRLESLLELALRTSVVNSDKYKDDVKVTLVPHDLLTQLHLILKLPDERTLDTSTCITGLEAFAFDYEVNWPLSLVINQKALSYYKLMFRHLFYCKHVERLLGKVWTINKIVKSYPIYISSSYASAFALHQRMLNFVQNLYYYVTLEVIEPYWQTFRFQIQQVSNVDEVIKCHNKFLQSCANDCMLVSPDVLKILQKLIELCVSFANFMQKTRKASIQAEFTSMEGSCSAPIYEEAEYTSMAGSAEPASTQMSFQQHITFFHKEFDAHFVKLMDQISCLDSNKYSKCTTMVNMLYTRLDFNGFYVRSQETSTKC